MLFVTVFAFLFVALVGFVFPPAWVVAVILIPFVGLGIAAIVSRTDFDGSIAEES